MFTPKKTTALHLLPSPTPYHDTIDQHPSMFLYTLVDCGFSLIGLSLGCLHTIIYFTPFPIGVGRYNSPPPATILTYINTHQCYHACRFQKHVKKA